MISALACFSAGAKSVFTIGDWVYEKINNNTEFEIDLYKGTSEVVNNVCIVNTLPVTSIGSEAFRANKTLVNMIVLETITDIHSNAFQDSVALETVEFVDADVEYIGNNAFSGCTSLSSINLEDTVITAVSNSTFMNCDSLVEVTLPETVVSIEANAFSYCDSLAKVTIPESVTEIHEKAFYNTPNVVIYCYEDSAAHVFAETNSIEYVLLEPPVTYILGDVDNSGDVAIMDATEVQLLIAQLVEPQDEYTQLRADIDSDGVLSIMDATSIQMFIADIEVEYPIGETFEV